MTSNLPLLRPLIVIMLSMTLTACGVFGNAFEKNNAKGYSVGPIPSGGSVASGGSAVDSNQTGRTDKNSDLSEVETLRRRLIDQGFIQADCFNGTDAGTPRCIAGRNNVLAEVIARSDAACNEHLTSIYANDAGYNILLGTLTSLFTGAATVMSGLRAKSNLAALGFLANSERSLINDVVYKTVLVPAIHTKIVETRDVRRTSFRGLYSKSLVEYPASLALSDALNYHYTCSFMEGMRLALKEGTNETKALVLRDQARRAETDMAQAQMMFAAIRGITVGAAVDNPQLEKDPAYKAAKERFTQNAQQYTHAQASVAGYLPSGVASGETIVNAPAVVTQPIHPPTTSTSVTTPFEKVVKADADKVPFSYPAAVAGALQLQKLLNSQRTGTAIKEDGIPGDETSCAVKAITKEFLKDTPPGPPDACARMDARRKLRAKPKPT